MSQRIRKDFQIPVVITHTKHKCDIYVPDFEVTIHGDDYVDAISNAIMKISAIYYYNLERNLTINLTTTYADAEKLCNNKRNSFATYIALTA